MQDLHLVGFTTDRRHLIFSTREGAKSGNFVVPVDEDLLAAIDEMSASAGKEIVEHEEPVAPEPVAPRVEARLSVREVQARLRAGADVADVAADAGVDDAWVERFAPPVRAEQRRIVERALAMPMERSRAGLSTVPLRRAVAASMADREVSFTAEGFEAAWSSRLIGADRWMVEFTFVQRGRTRTVAWAFDAADRTLTTSDRTASQIGFVGEDDLVPPASETVGAEVPAGGVVTATAAQSSGAGRGRRPSTGARPASRTSEPAKKPTSKNTRAKKAGASKKAAQKKAAQKKVAQKKVAQKKAAQKKAAQKKAAQKKAAQKKAAQKKAAQKKAAQKKAGQREREKARAVEKKRAATAKKAAVRKAAAAKKKAGAKKAVAAKKKAAAEKRAPAKRAPAKKSVVKKTAAKKSVVKKTAAKKTAAKKRMPKKIAAEEPTAEKQPVTTEPVAPPENEPTTQTGRRRHPIVVHRQTTDTDPAQAEAEEDRPSREEPVEDAAVENERAGQAPVEGETGPPERIVARRSRAADRNAPTAQFRTGSAVQAAAAGNGAAWPRPRPRRADDPAALAARQQASDDALASDEHAEETGPAGSEAPRVSNGRPDRPPRRTRQLRAR